MQTVDVYSQCIPRTVFLLAFLFKCAVYDALPGLVLCRNVPSRVFVLARGRLDGCESILLCSGRTFFPFCQ